MTFPKRAGLILFGVVLIRYGVGAARAQVTMPAAASEAPLPADVDPVSRNRLPLPTRADMANDEERKIFDEESVRASSSRLYSPEVAKALDDAHAYEKFNTALGSRLVQIAVLVTARELDNQFEWTQWEEHGLLSGQKSLVEPAIVETIKYCKPVVGLGSEGDRDHQVRPRVVRAAKEGFVANICRNPRLFGRRDERWIWWS